MTDWDNMEKWEIYLFRRLLYSKYRQPRKNALLNLSGGTDSALVFYLICEYVVKNDIQGFQITPIHGWDMNRVNAYSPDAAKKVYSYIKDKFPTVKINDLYIFAYHKLKGETKSKYHNPVFRLFEKEGLCDPGMIFSGTTLSPQDQSYKPPVDINLNGSIDRQANPTFNRNVGDKTAKGVNYEDSNIICSYDKKWVSRMYQEKNLTEIFQHTVSCIGDEPNGPCKKCWWCHEKYWAFGHYDGESLKAEV